MEEEKHHHKWDQRKKLNIINIEKFDVKLGDTESKRSETIKYFEDMRVIQWKEKNNDPKILNDQRLIVSNDKESVNHNAFFYDWLVKNEQMEPKEYSPMAMQKSISLNAKYEKL